MKTLFRMTGMAAIAACGLFLASCDALEDATTVDVPIEVTFSVNTSGTAPKTLTDCTDLNDYGDYAEYKDKIDGGTVESVTFQAWSYAGDPPAATAVMTTIRYTLQFDASYGDPTEYELATITNQSVQQLLNGPVTIPVDNPALNSILSQLKNRPKFCVKQYYGTFTTGSGMIEIFMGELKVKFALKASAL
jgi:hypothetical protein